MAATATASATVTATRALLPDAAPRAKTLFPPEKFRLQKGRIYRRVVAKLPPQYQKFYEEWQNGTPSKPIHWIPRPEKWSRNPQTGEIKVVQNCPIPVMFPHQSHKGIWGGEGVVEGLVKKAKFRRPVPWFWVPQLTKSVVYSEVLNKHLSVVVTDTTHQRIDEYEGLDSYLLKSPAYDLQSMLALKIKRKILLALLNKDFSHDDPENQQRLLEKYKDYLLPADEVEWYGLTVNEAQVKFDQLQKQIAKNAKVPLKYKFRQELLERLKVEQLNAAENPPEEKSGVSSLMSKLNPFSKPSGMPEKMT